MTVANGGCTVRADALEHGPVALTPADFALKWSVAFALRALARMLLRHRTSARFARDGNPIFPTATGRHQDAHNVRKRLKKVTTALGIPWVTPHKFRHSFATWLRDNGYDVNDIARVLGHTDPAFTRRVYIHAQDVPRFDDLPGAGGIEAAD